MQRRLIALLVITVLLSFSWPLLLSIPDAESACTCGCRADGRACSCCCGPKASDLNETRFQAILQGGGHNCPCTAASLQLLGLKIQAILKERLLIAASSFGQLRTRSFAGRPPDASLRLHRQRAPPA